MKDSEKILKDLSCLAWKIEKQEIRIDSILDEIDRRKPSTVYIYKRNGFFR